MTINPRKLAAVKRQILSRLRQVTVGSPAWRVLVLELENVAYLRRFVK